MDFLRGEESGKTAHNGMEFDDLDRELAEYNAEIVKPEPEESGKNERTVWTPSFSPTEIDASGLPSWETASETGAEQTADYEMTYQHIENTASKLNDQLEYARKEYQTAEEQKKKQGEILGKEWVGTTAFFLLVFIVMFVLRRTELQSAWWLLLGFIVVFMIRQYLVLLNSTATHRILCIDKPVSTYVEEKKVNTYLKRQEYWHARMKDIKEHQEKLKSFERKLKNDGVLSEEETALVRGLVHVNQHPSTYTIEKFNIRDWMEYRSKG